MDKTMSIGIVVGALVLSGCSVFAPSPTATPAPTATPEPVLASSVDDLVGIWRRTAAMPNDLTPHLQFSQDGTWRIANVVEELETAILVEGEFEFEGAQLIWRDTGGVPPFSDCTTEADWVEATYEVEIRPSGNLRFTAIQDLCPLRIDPLSTGTQWEPVP